MPFMSARYICAVCVVPVVYIAVCCSNGLSYNPILKLCDVGILNIVD